MKAKPFVFESVCIIRAFRPGKCSL